MTKPQEVQWVNLPNGEPGIVLCYWDVLGQRSTVEEAVHVTATDRYKRFTTFEITEDTFEKVMLQ